MFTKVLNKLGVTTKAQKYDRWVEQLNDMWKFAHGVRADALELCKQLRNVEKQYLASAASQNRLEVKASMVELFEQLEKVNAFIEMFDGLYEDMVGVRNSALVRVYPKLQHVSVWDLRRQFAA